ncbi:MAG: nitroreductase family protein [Micavibrio sp.]
MNPVSALPLPAMIDFLQRRRSSKISNLAEPGPTTDQLQIILKSAARVPDHGKLVPWRFIVFAGDSRAKAGVLLRDAWRHEDPDAAEAKLDLEAERFLRAPLVVAVVSSMKEGKSPEWEQILSAGAACYNLCLAANGLGFASTWITEWYAYNPVFQKAMGLDPEKEKFAGFIYLGTAKADPEERERPRLEDIVRYF